MLPNLEMLAQARDTKQAWLRYVKFIHFEFYFKYKLVKFIYVQFGEKNKNSWPTYMHK